MALQILPHTGREGWENERLRMLVTGGCGFIGSNFIRKVLAENSNVTVVNLDSLSYGSNRKNLEGVDKKRYKFVRGDITDEGVVRKLVGEADLVVNFAAESHVDRSIPDPLLFFDTNVRGVLSLLEALRTSNHPVRMVQVSTDEVYGSIARGFVTEKGETNPSSPYAASKAAGDAYCLAYNRTYGVDVTVCRSTNNFGPYQFPEKLIPKTAIRAVLGLRIPIYGSGDQVRDWLHVGDNCKAIAIVLRKGRSGEVYNIAGENQISNVSLVKQILEILGKPSSVIEHVEDRPGHDIRYSLNCNKLKRELGWRREERFENALARTVEWYVRNKAWWKQLATEDVLHPTPWKLGRIRETR